MKIDTVLFDIGNVLVPDYWESLWLTKGRGLADRLGISVATAASIGKKLWTKYDRVTTREEDYWREFAAEVGMDILPIMIAKAEAELIVPNPHARAIVEDLSRRGFRIGIVSNNTTFFAPKQLASLGCGSLFDPALVFLSCEKGVAKGAPSPDLFATAAGITDPARTLVIDDRPHNIECARRAGFAAHLYPYTHLYPYDAWNSDTDEYYRPGPYDAFKLDEVLGG